MIEFVKASILDVDAEALVNPVNCVGVCGAGLAYLFKEKYVENYLAYRISCSEKLIMPGKVMCYELMTQDNPKYIINFPTKDHWINPSRMEWIEAGLDDMVEVIERMKIRSIAVPALGCGLGGLDWGDVYKLIYDKLTPIPDLEIIGFFQKGYAS